MAVFKIFPTATQFQNLFSVLIFAELLTVCKVGFQFEKYFLGGDSQWCTQ